MFRRVKSVLDRSPAFLAASDDLRRITQAYKASAQAMDAGAHPAVELCAFMLCVCLCV